MKYMLMLMVFMLPDLGYASDQNPTLKELEASIQELKDQLKSEREDREFYEKQNAELADFIYRECGE